MFPIQEIAETSEKALEKLLIQIKDLEDENFKLKRMNEIFEFEIENLQKAQLISEKSKPSGHMKFNDLFSTKIASTQTNAFYSGSNEKALDWIQMNLCMASALEDLLTSNVKFGY